MRDGVGGRNERTCGWAGWEVVRIRKKPFLHSTSFYANPRIVLS